MRWTGHAELMGEREIRTNISRKIWR